MYVEGCLPGHGSADAEVVKRAMADTAVEREVTSMLIVLEIIECTKMTRDWNDHNAFEVFSKR